MKRIFIIVGILIAAAAIVAVGMLLRDRASAPEAPAGTLPISGTLPIASDGGAQTGTPAGDSGEATAGTPSGTLPIAGIEAVAQAAVIDYAVTPRGVIFLASNGAVISATNAEMLGQADFGDILDASFSPDGKWLLVKSAKDSGASWNILDVGKKTWKGIQATASEMLWSPKGDRLAYFSNLASKSSLNTYAPSTGATKTLLTLSSPDLRLRWKDDSKIFIMDRPSSLVPGSIWEFDPAAGTLLPFVANVSGADILWGGERNGGLLFRAGPTSGLLMLVDSAGGPTQTTNFITLPSKCAFGEAVATSTIEDISDYLFCAIPNNQQAMKSASLPEDYLMGKFGTADSLYAVNIARGVLTLLSPSSQTFEFDAEKLRVYGENAYFINRRDSKLYKVSLSGLPTYSMPATDGS